jgi:hypothetical protein
MTDIPSSKTLATRLRKFHSFRAAHLDPFLCIWLTKKWLNNRAKPESVPRQRSPFYVDEEYCRAFKSTAAKPRSPQHQAHIEDVLDGVTASLEEVKRPNAGGGLAMTDSTWRRSYPSTSMSRETRRGSPHSPDPSWRRRGACGYHWRVHIGRGGRGRPHRGRHRLHRHCRRPSPSAEPAPGPRCALVEKLSLCHHSSPRRRSREEAAVDVYIARRDLEF